MDMEAKIKELENNKEFMDKIAGLDNLADAAKAFNDEGVEVTEEELKKAGEFFEAQEGEIIEDQLENVSGGCFYIAAGVIAGGYYAMWRRAQKRHGCGGR